MIIQCLARRPGAARALASASRRIQQTPSFTRSKYHIPTLDRHDEVVEKGIPRLFSREGFKTAYTDYEQHMIDELNASTAGTPFEGQEIKALVIEFARDPARAYAFNIASMAFNNHFFFRGINSNPDIKSQPTRDLTFQINRDFSSAETLRDTFLATAEAMFGPGFVWLVQTPNSFRILPTYLAGSPLSGAHYRRQSHDLNTHNADSYQALNKVGTFGSAAGHKTGPKQALGGVDVIPLMCVSTWEHTWLQDYGVRGKREFLERWWDMIDWSVVAQYSTLKQRHANHNEFRYS